MQCLLELEVENPLYIVATEGYTISENRAYILNQARKANCTHLLFIDDDMVFPKDTLTRLMSHKEAVVGLPYHSRTLENKAYNIIDEEGKAVTELPEELFKVQHVGTGVMLIDLSIIPDLKMPYFFMETHETGFTLTGEDAWFCLQVRKAGHSVWCDPNIKDIKHLGDYIY